MSEAVWVLVISVMVAIFLIGMALGTIQAARENRAKPQRDAGQNLLIAEPGECLVLHQTPDTIEAWVESGDPEEASSVGERRGGRLIERII